MKLFWEYNLEYTETDGINWTFISVSLKKSRLLGLFLRDNGGAYMAKVEGASYRARNQTLEKKKKIGNEIYFRMKLAQISWEDKVLRVGEGKL